MKPPTLLDVPKVMRTYPGGFRWWLAGWLCRCACWLRGERWYVADTWHGVPCNRASELEQKIWAEVVLLEAGVPIKDRQALDGIARNLAELSQTAGAAWGHVWPKDAQ